MESGEGEDEPSGLVLALQANERGRTGFAPSDDSEVDEVGDDHSSLLRARTGKTGDRSDRHLHLRARQDGENASLYARDQGFDRPNIVHVTTLL
jgi:hypothetical protein